MSANACPTLPLHKSRLELRRHLEILQTVLPDLLESNGPGHGIVQEQAGLSSIALPNR